MRVRRYFRRPVVPSTEEKYTNANFERGYAIRELRVREPRQGRRVVSSFAGQEIVTAPFLEFYSPENAVLSSDGVSHYRLALLSRWLTYSSGFVLPTDSLSSLCQALQDGVILAKLMYNFFELSENDKFALMKENIRDKFIANPASEQEQLSNFSLFEESCGRLGLDTFQRLKRTDLLAGKVNVIEKLLVLEDTLFTANSFSGYASDEDAESEGDYNSSVKNSINLKGQVVSESKNARVQEKRLVEFYNIAIKNRKRTMKERLQALSSSFKEEFPEWEFAANKASTYLEAIGQLELPESFWTLKSTPPIFDVSEDQESCREGTETSSETTHGTHETAYLYDKESSPSIDVERVEKGCEGSELEGSVASTGEASPKEYVPSVEERTSQIFYLLSDEKGKEEKEEAQERDLVILENEDAMSLTSKMSLLFHHEPKEEVLSTKSEKSVVYYVIEELNEVEKGLSSMTDNIISRLEKLKVKDRIVRAMDIFSSSPSVSGREAKISEEQEDSLVREVRDIGRCLEEVSLLKKQVGEGELC